MRYSRLKRKKTKQRYATFILVVVLIFAIIYVISAGTIGKFVSNIISPILSSFDKGSTDTPTAPPEDDPLLTISDKSNEGVVKITDTIKANTLSMKAIQMGAFTANENAGVFADDLRTKGGAGYIIEDTYFRVLAIGFQSQEDAVKVREQLKVDGIESQVYEITSAGASMQITATENNVSAIKSAFATWEEKYIALEKVLKDLDSSSIAASDAYKIMEEFKGVIDAKRDELSGLAAVQDNNPILTGLLELYQSGSKSFEDILAESSTNKVAISSKIKYTYIEMMMKYKDYMEKITKS